jgi:hypothetical protein
LRVPARRRQTRQRHRLVQGRRFPAPRRAHASGVSPFTWPLGCGDARARDRSGLSSGPSYPSTSLVAPAWRSRCRWAAQRPTGRRSPQGGRVRHGGRLRPKAGDGREQRGRLRRVLCAHDQLHPADVVVEHHELGRFRPTHLTPGHPAHLRGHRRIDHVRCGASAPGGWRRRELPPVHELNKKVVRPRTCALGTIGRRGPLEEARTRRPDR